MFRKKQTGEDDSTLLAILEKPLQRGRKKACKRGEDEGESADEWKAQDANLKEECASVGKDGQSES